MTLTVAAQADTSPSPNLPGESKQRLSDKTSLAHIIISKKKKKLLDLSVRDSPDILNTNIEIL